MEATHNAKLLRELGLPQLIVSISFSLQTSTKFKFSFDYEPEAPEATLIQNGAPDCHMESDHASPRAQVNANTGGNGASSEFSNTYTFPSLGDDNCNNKHDLPNGVAGDDGMLDSCDSVWDSVNAPSSVATVMDFQSWATKLDFRTYMQMQSGQDGTANAALEGHDIDDDDDKLGQGSEAMTTMHRSKRRRW